MTRAAKTLAVAQPPTPGRAGPLIGILVASTFVMILNETVLGVALPELAVDLAVPVTTVQWLTSGYLLTMAVVIPTTGYLLERWTPRRIFLTAMSLFCGGTLLGLLAPGFTVLLAARVVQAAGTAVMMPLLTTTVMRLIPADRRGATMGTVGIVIAVAPALGPTVGGLVVSTLGWRALFGLVLPLALAALLIGARSLRLDSAVRPVPLDVVSVVLSTAAFGGLVYGLSSLGEPAGGSALATWAPIGAGGVALVVFVARQVQLQRHDRALLNLRPVGNRGFAVALALMTLLFLCLLGVSILLPLYVQTVLGATALTSGLIALPGGLMLGLLGRPIGTLFDRIGARRLVIPGAAVVAVALILFTQLGPGSPVFAVLGLHVMIMTGIALLMTPLMTEALGALPTTLHAHGSAILSTAQQVAGATGIALFVTVAATSSTTTRTPDVDGLHAAFVVAAGLGVLMFATSLLVPSRRPARPLTV